MSCGVRLQTAISRRWRRSARPRASKCTRSCFRPVPGLVYWNGTTVECLNRVRALRKEGVSVFFTIDAGPQVKAVCLPEAYDTVFQALEDIPGIRSTLGSGLGEGARVVRG